MAGTKLLRGSTHRRAFLPSRPGGPLGAGSPWNSDGPGSTGWASLPWRSLGEARKWFISKALQLHGCDFLKLHTIVPRTPHSRARHSSPGPCVSTNCWASHLRLFLSPSHDSKSPQSI